MAYSAALADSSRSACLIFDRALEVLTNVSQSRLGDCVGEVTTSTESPFWSVCRMGTFLPFTLPEMHPQPIFEWMAKAKSSTVAPLPSLITSPVGVKT